MPATGHAVRGGQGGQTGLLAVAVNVPGLQLSHAVLPSADAKPRRQLIGLNVPDVGQRVPAGHL